MLQHPHAVVDMNNSRDILRGSALTFPPPLPDAFMAAGKVGFQNIDYFFTVW